MRSFHALAIALTLALVVVAESRADETVSPGPTAAYTYLTGIPITTGYNLGTTVEIVKGRKNRVIEADVQLTDTQELAAALATYVSVNGVHMYPQQTNIPVMTDCDPAYENCTISSNFWADLDALEQANPGVFRNQPLVFSIFVITGGANTTGSLSARVRMIKK